MPNFDLGSDLVLERTVPARIERAYALSRQLVLGYEGMGFSVIFTDEQPPRALQAEIRDQQGTRIQADLALEPQGRLSSLRVLLRGSVHVGGVQGMLATAAMVRKVALERLSNLLERTFRDVADDVPGVTDLEPESEPSSPSTPLDSDSDSGSDLTDPIQRRLETIKILVERGLITQDDYGRKKRELLELL